VGIIYRVSPAVPTFLSDGLGATNVDGMAKILEVDEKVPLFGIRTAS